MLINCQCSDTGCSVHDGRSWCSNQAIVTLYRIDMQDETGTPVCSECADDAFKSGLFTDAECIDEEDTDDD